MLTIEEGHHHKQHHFQMCILGVLACVVVAVAQTPGAGSSPVPPGQRGQQSGVQGQGRGGDWANLAQYRQANASLGPPAAKENRVVFMGDSITAFWARQPLFQKKSYINRGISAQTTPQMLLRFRQDVINLQPKVVVILAGTNDIAGNTGPATPEMIQDNLKSMVELAQVNRIKVVLASILPAGAYSWNPEVKPASIIVQMNAWLKDYSAKNGLVYVDFHTPMADENGAMKREYSSDGVHPNAAGVRGHGATDGESYRHRTGNQVSCRGIK